MAAHVPFCQCVCVWCVYDMSQYGYPGGTCTAYIYYQYFDVPITRVMFS